MAADLFDPAPDILGVICKEDGGFSEWIRGQSEFFVMIMWGLPAVLGLFVTEYTLLFMFLCHYPQNFILYILSNLINEPRPPTCKEINDIIANIAPESQYNGSMDYDYNTTPVLSVKNHVNDRNSFLDTNSDAFFDHISPAITDAFSEMKTAVYSSANALGISPNLFSASWHRTVYAYNGVVFSPASPCREAMIVWALCCFTIAHVSMRRRSSRKGLFSLANNSKLKKIMIAWSVFVTIGVTYSKLNFLDQTFLGCVVGSLFGFGCAYYLEFYAREIIPHLLKTPVLSRFGYSDNIFGFKIKLPAFISYSSGASPQTTSIHTDINININDDIP